MIFQYYFFVLKIQENYDALIGIFIILIIENKLNVFFC